MSLEAFVKTVTLLGLLGLVIAKPELIVKVVDTVVAVMTGIFDVAGKG